MSDERKKMNDEGGEPMTPSPEERRLEALLAEMPRRRCPSSVRENVLATLRDEMEAKPVVAEPVPAKVVAVWFRRPVFRVLELAAVVAIAAIGLKVYLDLRSQFRVQPDELASQSAREAAPTAPAVAETDGDSYRMPKMPALAERPATPPAPAVPAASVPAVAEKKGAELALKDGSFAAPLGKTDGVALKAASTPPMISRGIAAEKVEAAAQETERKKEEGAGDVSLYVYGKAGADQKSAPERLPQLAELGVRVAPIPASAATAADELRAPLPAAPPGFAGMSAAPAVVAPAPAAQPAAVPPTEPGAIEPKAATIAATKGGADVSPKSGPLMKSIPAAAGVSPGGGPAVREKAGDLAGQLGYGGYGLAPAEQLDWFALETSAPVRGQTTERNQISEIQLARPPADQEIRQNVAETTWTAFRQRAVASFGQLIGEFGGRITDSQEITVMPGERRALLVECVLPAANGDGLLNTVNQKRMVAIANTLAIPADTSLGQAAARRGGGTRQAQAAGRPVFNIQNTPRNVVVQRMDEKGLANNRESLFSNFFVQTPSPTQVANLQNQQQQRYSRAVPPRRPAAGAQSQLRQSEQPQAAPVQNVQSGLGGNYRAYGQNRQMGDGATSPGGSGVAGGAPALQPAAPPLQEARLCFILEPDRLPMPVTLPAAQQPAR